MSILIIAAFCFLYLFGRITIKNKISEFVFNSFLGWWLILLIISLSNPYSLYSVSAEIYFLLLTSVISFSIGFLLNEVAQRKVSNFTKVSWNENIMLQTYKSLTESKYFIALLIFLSLYVGNYALKYQQYVFIYGPDEARTMRFFVGPIFKSSVEIFFYNFFVESFSVLVSLIIAISLVWKKFSKSFFLSLLFAYLYSSFGAGRLYIIETGFLVLFFLFIKVKLFNSGRVSFNKIIKNIKLGVLIFAFLIGGYVYSIYLSNFRNGINKVSLDNLVEGNNEFMTHIVVYCIGSFRALEYGVNVTSLKMENTLGSLSFGGLDEIIGVFLNSIGIKYEYSNLIYGEYTYSQISIGVGQTFNALYTHVFGQYLDFGLLGVVLLSIFWGNVFNRIIVYCFKSNSIYSFMAAAYIFLILIMTPLMWKLQSPSSWLFLGVIFFFHYKANKQKRNYV